MVSDVISYAKIIYDNIAKPKCSLIFSEIH